MQYLFELWSMFQKGLKKIKEKEQFFISSKIKILKFDKR